MPQREDDRDSFSEIVVVEDEDPEDANGDQHAADRREDRIDQILAERVLGEQRQG